MDCSICFDAITKATGSTTLSCEHAFHFRCIDEWFTKQLLDNLHQTCPCCRSEGAELDRCMYEEVSEEGDDDYATEEDAESETASDANSVLDEIPWEMADLLWERGGEGRWVVTSRQELAYQGLRSLFGEMNELEVQEETSQEVAARKIQAIFRGFKTREMYRTVRTLLALVN